ncbi:discoidin domain-containing protein [Marinicellulosiphila megalodicopiae]|uniref:discoidin domain-containing protein n=1 Tax=Marinicellulosiphila megalodicopiae TaxID=2724896 RepID=UPI003BAFDAD1
MNNHIVLTSALSTALIFSSCGDSTEDAVTPTDVTDTQTQETTTQTGSEVLTQTESETKTDTPTESEVPTQTQTKTKTETETETEVITETQTDTTIAPVLINGVWISASASDENLPVNVYDQDINTRWSAQGIGQWIQFEFNDTQTLEGLDIAFVKGDERTTDFTFEYSSDALQWTEISTHTSSGASLDFEYFDINPTNTQFLRIVGGGNSISDWSSLAEVIFYFDEDKVITPTQTETETETEITVEYDLYSQTGEDDLWMDVLAKDNLQPLGQTSTTGVTGSIINVKNALVETTPYAKNAQLGEHLKLHTVANSDIDSNDFSKWSRWYQEDGDTQIFRLFKSEENTRNSRALAARSEVYSPQNRWNVEAGVWREFQARFTIINAKGCGFEHTCSLMQAKGNEVDHWSVMLRLDGDGHLWFKPRVGDTFIVARNMEGKGIDLRVRDNGLDYEMYVDGILKGTGQWERTDEIGYRWGLYIGASEVVDDVMIFVSGVNMFSSQPPAGYIFAAHPNEEIHIKGQMDIAWGIDGDFVYLNNQTENITCENSSFDFDPAVGKTKQCFTKVSDNNDAPDGFTFIANGQAYFDVVGTMDIAFGAEGKFNYRRNLHADYPNTLTLQCNRANFGDPIPSVNKKCYYKSVPASQAPSGYEWVADEGKEVIINGEANLAFGTNGEFVYLNNQIGSVMCNNASFGSDPVPGVRKACYLQDLFVVSTTPTPDPDPEEVTTNGIKHPGMMTPISQLNILKTRFANGHAVTIARVQEMFDLINRNGRRIRNPEQENFAAGGAGLIYCGSYNKDKNGERTVQACNWPTEDGIDVYTLALLGFITGDAQYSEEAMDYLESWTNTDNFRGFDPEGSNAALQYGWVLPWYANAAEVLRYTYDGWTNSHTQDMNAFTNLMLPRVTGDKDGAANNWLHARIEAHMSAAIWLSNKNMMDKAISRWKEHTPSYIYIAADNGIPVMPTSSKSAEKGIRAWDTNKFVPGMTLETCRDLVHQDLGVRAIINTLVLAKSQGIDITQGNDNAERIRKYMEVQPKWGQSRQSNPDGVCKNPVVIQGNDTSGRMLKDNTVRFPMPLAHVLFATDNRPLNLALQDIEKSSATTAQRWIKKWESLYASTYFD